MWNMVFAGQNAKDRFVLDDKTPRAAVLLALDFVVADVTARLGDAPSAPTDYRHHSPKPKSPATASLKIFRQARA